MSKCIDCGKKLSLPKYTRCVTHANQYKRQIQKVFREDRLPNCKDCGKKLSGMNYKRCNKCAENTEEKKETRNRAIRGKKPWNYIEDRSKLKRNDNDNIARASSAYREWSLGVKERDGWTCRINNSDCSGRLESHHILSWRQHPQLRYEINNGITLCHFHHPRREVDENRLITFYQSLLRNKH